MIVALWSSRRSMLEHNFRVLPYYGMEVGLKASLLGGCGDAVMS
jgi:hypothetical protein